MRGDWGNGEWEWGMGDWEMGNGEWFFRYVQGNDIQARRADTIIERRSEWT